MTFSNNLIQRPIEDLRLFHSVEQPRVVFAPCLLRVHAFDHPDFKGLNKTLLAGGFIIARLARDHARFDG